MTEFEIRAEWEAAPSVQAAELSATWARITIRVGSDYVTLVEDQETASSRHSIYCPLYSLAEWAAYNWWFLQADARPARALSRHRGLSAVPRHEREHHSLRFSGDGFAWPDLLIVPDGAQSRLIWQDDPVPRPGWPVRFLSRGDRWVAADDVRSELAAVVSSVLTRLAEQGVGPTALAREWDAIGGADREVASFCLAAAQLGLDPYSDAQDYADDILRASRALRGDLLKDFLDAVSPSRIRSALGWISSAQARITAVPESTSNGGVVSALRSDARRGGQVAGISRWTPAWEAGWRDARFVRDRLGASSAEPIGLEDYISAQTIPGDDWLSIHALGGLAGRSPMAVTGRQAAPASARFTLARALWHCIWDDAPVFAITSAHTYRQAVERAFAAELLAPAAGIAAHLESSPQDAVQEELDQIAGHFEVSPLVIEHQVTNQLLGAPSD